ncbi:MAG TPA: alpha/beta hydrolase [Burkholderiales bacterium]|nr:alpha/beta hydrolase [Burkholderiales bacterium]
MKVFRDYTQGELDRQYEQRSFAPNADEIIKRYGAASDAVRARFGEPETLAYGPSAVEVLDVYGGRRDRIVAFVHGGAWARMGKRPSAFAAGTFLGAGATYVALGFGLLPSITLPEMVDQVCRALEFLREKLKPKSLVLIGHSSGAHLSACALTRVSFLDAALLISGVYDLEPVRLSSRNAYVRLDERLEREYSPIRHASRIVCPVTVACGGKEGPEFFRQSKELAEKLPTPLLVGEGLNHFEMVETLADGGSALGRKALELLT